MPASFMRLAAIALVTYAACSGSAVAVGNGEKKAAAVQVKTTNSREARNNWNSFANRTKPETGSKSGSSTCDSYHDKWKSTGTGFWRGRYYACIYGGW
ncbi:MAG: hypothetical protein ABL894_10990 [Hyphomicrobium sp.]